MAMIRVTLLGDAGDEQDSFTVECDGLAEAVETFADLADVFEFEAEEGEGDDDAA